MEMIRRAESDDDSRQELDDHACRSREPGNLNLFFFPSRPPITPSFSSTPPTPAIVTEKPLSPHHNFLSNAFFTFTLFEYRAIMSRGQNPRAFRVLITQRYQNIDQAIPPLRQHLLYWIRFYSRTGRPASALEVQDRLNQLELIAINLYDDYQHCLVIHSISRLERINDRLIAIRQHHPRLGRRPLLPSHDYSWLLQRDLDRSAAASRITSPPSSSRLNNDSLASRGRETDPNG